VAEGGGGAISSCAALESRGGGERTWCRLGREGHVAEGGEVGRGRVWGFCGGETWRVVK